MPPTPPIPHCSPPDWPADIPATRFASTIRVGDPAGCRVALIGLADDLGVRLNNGRPGARAGPRAFRQALARYGNAQPAGWEWPAVFDAGDITPAPGDDEPALHETHKRVTETVGALVRLGLFPIGIGGGHDLTFPFVRAAAAVRGPMAGVYFDPHLDVRENAGSGMPFRRLIEDCDVGPIVNTGFEPAVNSRDHHKWFLAKGGRIASFPSDRWPDLGKPQFVSLDLDCVTAGEAPGVSAPNPAGITIAELARYAWRAGRSPSVACFDIMELNPAHDVDGRTARAAAHVFLSFLHGFAERTA